MRRAVLIQMMSATAHFALDMESTTDSVATSSLDELEDRGERNSNGH